MNLVAGVGVAKVVVSWVTKGPKPLNDMMGAPAVSLTAPAPTLNNGANSGRPFAAGTAAAGTMIGLAPKVVISTVSAPMRSCPEPNAALARSMLKPVEVSVAKGAAVPDPVQVTARVAGTLDSACTDCARKSGGAEPKGDT